MSRNEAERVFSNASDYEIIEVVQRLANTQGDWEWKQDICLFYLGSTSVDIQRVSVRSLGDIARINRQIDVERVRTVLKEAGRYQELQGYVEDALNDIKIFTKQ